MSRIEDSLASLFKQQRLIFWYDPEADLKSEFEDVAPEGVTKLTVENNEFGLKYRIMREEPKEKFLLYLPYPRPSTQDNWLLDLELASKVFNADAKSLMLQELDLEEDDRSFIDAYPHFFRLKSNRIKLAKHLHPDDLPSERTLKMLAVLCKSEPAIDAVLLSLIADQESGNSSILKEISENALTEDLWTHAQKYFSFNSKHTSLTDLLVEIFQQATPIGSDTPRHQQSSVFLNRWKDSARYKDTFEPASDQVAEILGIDQMLQDLTDYTSLAELDSYKKIDLGIIVMLQQGIHSRQIPLEQIHDIVQQRKRGFWYERYRHIYACLLEGAELLHGLESYDFNISSFDQGITSYTSRWFSLDGNHRRLLYHLRKANQRTQLSEFAAQTEGRYLNEFVRPVNQKVSAQLEKLDRWESGLTAQQQFYQAHVQPFVSKGHKVYVIISDAFRYEIAHELMNRVHQEDKFKASLTPMMSSLPSYTQLGMASLLPNSEVMVNSKDGAAKVDGQSASGIENRQKILQAGTPGQTCAIKLEDFLAMNAKEEGRDLAKGHDVVYIYHNGIDAMGDKRETEDKLPDAVEEEIRLLLAAMKKVAAINGSNLLITADHGFLYQSIQPSEAEYTAIDKSQFTNLSRRYALAEQADESGAMHVFSASQLNLTGDNYFHIPKGTQRLKVQGAGARFVHGGASLQEIIIPVLHVTKSRETDTTHTGVDVIRTGSNKITTTEVPIRLYQSDPVGEKILPRRLRISFHGGDDTQISEQKELVFNSTDTDPRLREQKVSLMLSPKADQYLNQEIYLKLSEPVEGSSHSIPYLNYPYRYEKHFTSDFEDF